MSLAPLKVRVIEKRVVAEDICSFLLEQADGRPLPPFSAGSHVDVKVADGLVRQYSLCNEPGAAGCYLIGVLREVVSRGGSQAMHERVQVGDVIEISEPRNHFPLAHEARHSLLLAGGIGVTPILCMARRLATVGASFAMHYCARSRRRAAFADEIAAAAFADQVRFHFDDEAGGEPIDLDALVASPDDGTHLYVCGPKGFMDAVLSKARAAGWPEARLHYEFFQAEVAHSDSDGGFEVALASTGQVIDVGKDQTVIQALMAAGIEVPVSCEQGVCGTCLTRVLEGTPDHRDLYLTPEEQALNDQFTPCCSRALTPRLTLDL